jgi:transketolase
MVRTAIDIAVESYPEASVWSVPIIKPINNIQIEKICRDSKAIVVFEEHSKYGGLGSLVAEISAEHSPIKILRIAVNDCFSEKCGTYEYLLKEHGLDIETIHANIRSFLRNV